MMPNDANANGDVIQTDDECEVTDGAVIEPQDESEQSDAGATGNGPHDEGSITQPCQEMTDSDRGFEGEVDQCNPMLEEPGSQPLPKPGDEMMARSVALGCTRAETARTVNRSVETVYRRLKDPDFVARVNVLRGNFDATTNELANKLLSTAVYRACDFINDPEFDLDRMDTLLEIIDRFFVYKGEIPDFD
ncbi:MAG: hypothetical protein RIC12_00245 [Pirellulales bacterium]